jgi:glycosyltransferase involved in cell wall biosynthesis
VIAYPGVVAKERIRKSLGFSEIAGPITFINVGSPGKRKNQRALVQLARELEPFIDNFRVLIIGREEEPGSIAEIERFAREQGVAHRVLCAGPRSPRVVRRLIRRSCLYLQSSKSESFGIAPLEAVSEGIPALALDQPAAREILPPSAILPRADFARTTAAKVLQLLCSPERRSRLWTAQVARVRDLFSVEATRRAYREIYLNNPNTPTGVRS